MGISKYDIPMDMIVKNQGSQGKILAQISPGAFVLECGCSTGYMTRYMTEVIGANVYIIECDEESYKQAIQFAEDGICTDLSENKWLTKYSNQKFDFIIFADVLEHLFDPESVLKNSTLLLKDDGKILISIPNVTHNDIIMSMYDNRWRYSSVGLLDDTHIRFFGEEDLDLFMKRAGLDIILQDAVMCPTLTTEQKCYNQSLNSLFIDCLKQRPFGEVYQFILTAQKSDYVKKNNISKQVILPNVEERLSKMYFAESSELLSESNCISKKYFVNEYYHYNFEIPKMGVNVIRFDPIEDNACIVKDLEIYANGTKVNTYPINGVRCSVQDIFCTTDPQYYIEIGRDFFGVINIKAWIVPINDLKFLETLNQILNVFQQKANECNLLRSSVKKLENEKDALTAKFSHELENTKSVVEHICQKVTEVNTIEQAYLQLENNYKQLEIDHAKSKAIEKDYSKLTTNYELIQKELIMEKEKYKELINSTTWKISSPIRKLIDYFKGKANK